MQDAHGFEQQLRRILVAGGWQVVHPKRDVDVDFVALMPPHKYAVEVKAAKESRRQLLEGVLASAILRSRVAAQMLGAKPLAVVWAPSISDAVLRELKLFVDRFGEGAAWGAADESGLVVFHGEGLDDLSQRRRSAPKLPAVAHRADFLSDLGQWMLKVIVSHRLPRELRVHSPSDGDDIERPVSSANELSRLAEVSVPSASRLLASLRQERLISEGFPISVIRENELLARWRSAHQRRQRELRARWLFPQKQPQRHLDDVLRRCSQEAGRRACLGLFDACDRLGFSFVSGVAPHVYLEKLSVENVHALGLRLAEPGESADVFVREPRFPESVFRGALRREGVPVADILQCWVDVSNHPARGEEMANHLYDKVIGPCIAGHD